MDPSPFFFSKMTPNFCTGLHAYVTGLMNTHRPYNTSNGTSNYFILTLHHVENLGECLEKPLKRRDQIPTSWWSYVIYLFESGVHGMCHTCITQLISRRIQAVMKARGDVGIY